MLTGDSTGSSGDIAAVYCSRCGSDHLAWRVRRSSRGSSRLAERAVQWTCRNCGMEWSERIAQPDSPEWSTSDDHDDS
jgi:hypothetical protein